MRLLLRGSLLYTISVITLIGYIYILANNQQVINYNFSLSNYVHYFTRVRKFREGINYFYLLSIKFNQIAALALFVRPLIMIPLVHIFLTKIWWIWKVVKPYVEKKDVYNVRSVSLTNYDVYLGLERQDIASSDTICQLLLFAAIFLIFVHYSVAGQSFWTFYYEKPVEAPSKPAHEDHSKPSASTHNDKKEAVKQSSSKKNK